MSCEFFFDLCLVNSLKGAGPDQTTPDHTRPDHTRPHRVESGVNRGTVPKHIMKLQLASKEDKDITTMLSKGDWGDHDSPPENLPENMIKPEETKDY